ncbi:MAG: peptidylprolyl isomerase [Clostridiaceae bacterium]|nr:peptidylprolyl isomerase [Clostridiaceae bacterium]
MEIPFGTQEEQLEVVNKAIYTILVGGQSYKIGSRSLTRADLSELYAMQKALRSEIENDGDTGLLGDTSVAVFDGR